jgi:hypothetical protein
MIDKIKSFYSYSRTIFVARWYTLIGSVVAVHDSLGPHLVGQNFTPITTRVMDLAHVPPDARSVTLGVAAACTGELFVAMRKVTTQPLADKVP